MRTIAPRRHVHADAATALAAAAKRIEVAARNAIAGRGAFHIVLSGGETPRRLYALLATATGEWSKWHVYWGDERCVPVGDSQRNDAMARLAWLAASPIPRPQIHPIPAELGAEAGAAAYSQVLRDLQDFDLVLLGLGEDGHAASLFPGHDWGIQPESPAALAVFDSPKPPAQRVSLSAWRISASREVLVLVTGSGKRDALQRWERGEQLPIAAIAPAAGVDVILDRAAAGQGWPAL